MTYFVFPDIHGRLDLLSKALEFAYAAQRDGGKIIFLGDYIDRGPENKKVIETVMNPPEKWEFVCLMGNHEYMFLNAYHGKERFYDPGVVMEYGHPKATFEECVAAVPKEVIEWMKNLRLFHFEGPNVFAHAYYDYTLPKEQQNRDVILWDRMSDHEGYHSGGLHLTHGHTPRKFGPTKAINRTNLDCGAVFYGRYVIGEYEENVAGPIAFHEFEKWDK